MGHDWECIAVAAALALCAGYLLWDFLLWMEERRKSRIVRSLFHPLPQAPTVGATAAPDEGPAHFDTVREIVGVSVEVGMKQEVHLRGHVLGDTVNVETSFVLDFVYGSFTFDGAPMELGDVIEEIVASPRPVGVMLYHKRDGVPIKRGEFFTADNPCYV